MNVILAWAPAVVRVLVGLLFLISGLNGFLNFFPMPEHTGAAGAYMTGLAGAGYFFPLLKGTEVLAALMLLSGRLVPLALTVLAPIILNIAGFHIFLEHGGYGMVAFLFGAELFLAWSYRDSFRGVLDPAAKPVAAQGLSGATVSATAR